MPAVSTVIMQQAIFDVSLPVSSVCVPEWQQGSLVSPCCDCCCAMHIHPTEGLHLYPTLTHLKSVEMKGRLFFFT
jgi:hypothetical protein